MSILCKAQKDRKRKNTQPTLKEQETNEAQSYIISKF